MQTISQNPHRYRKILPWSVFITLALLILFAPIPVDAQTPGERIFRIDASRFAYTPSVLKVNPGDTVTIELVSHDVVHGLHLDGFNQEIIAEPGQTARLTFVADREGTFHFSCSITCGDMHPFMRGKLKVGTQNSLWRAAGLLFLAAASGIWITKR